MLWKNLAIVRGYMGDYTNASYAYRRYAELATNEQDAIEAEATAQLLTKNATEGIAEDLVVTYHLKDMAELERRLEESDRAEQVEIDPEDFVNEAPPKVIYALVDRPLVKSAPEIAHDDVPQVIAEVLIFYADGDDPPRSRIGGVSTAVGSSGSTVARDRRRNPGRAARPGSDRSNVRGRAGVVLALATARRRER